MWTEWRVMRKPSWHKRRAVRSFSVQPRSGLALNQGDGVFHPPEHAVLTATEALALRGRQAPGIQFPFAQDRELVLPRQRRMRNNLLRFRKKGPGVLERRLDIEFSRY